MTYPSFNVLRSEGIYFLLSIMFRGHQLLFYSLARPYVLFKRTSWFPTGGVVGLVILHMYILKQNVSQLHNKYFVTLQSDTKVCYLIAYVPLRVYRNTTICI